METGPAGVPCQVMGPEEPRVGAFEGKCQGLSKVWRKLRGGDHHTPAHMGI